MMTEPLAKLMKQAGLPGEFRVVDLPGGGNNRVYRIESMGPAALLKAYFQHPEDPRDRLGAEFAFCRFAWEAGVRCVPRPLACDRENGLGLYEFIEGRKISPGEVGPAEVQAAVEFFCELNRHKSDAGTLPVASEACFSIAEHLACVDRRMTRLEQVEGEAAEVIRTQLAPMWERIWSKTQTALDLAISTDQRCVSPSDFGFHNAIRTDGASPQPSPGVPGEGVKHGLAARATTLRFIDFEYAGWDDPAKTVCDFFCQPAVPVPREYLEMFVGAVDGGRKEFRDRVALLMPVYQIKWCCIMLNEFLPVGMRRRAFAKGAEDANERKMRQLEKVQAALEQIRE